MSEILNVPVANSPLPSPFVAFLRQRAIPLLYAGSSVATSAAQLVAGFLLLRWISPADSGLWTTVRLAEGYSFILLIGINNGLGRELPFALGKGEQAFADRLAGTAMYCATLANGLVMIAGAISALVFAYYTHYGAKLVYAILAVTVLIILAFYKQILICTFRSKDSFKILTTIQLVEAGLSMSTIPLVYFYGYNGMIGRTVLITLIVVSLLFVFRPMRVKMRMDLESLKLLLKTGVPIFGLDYLKTSCGTVDRLVLLQLGGAAAGLADVGIYNLARQAFQTLQVLPGSLGSYMYPRMTYKYGQNSDKRALWRFGLRFVLFSLGATSLAAICAWLILPWFVPAFIPKYLGGLHATQIVLVAGILEGATIIVNSLLSIKAWRLMMAYQLISATLFALGPVVGVLIIGQTLEAVAWGTVVGSACRGVLALTLAYFGTHPRTTPNPAATPTP